MKRWFVLCSALTCLAAPALAAGPSTLSPVSPAPAAPLASETKLDLQALFGAPAAQPATTDICNARLCSDDLDCACTGATTATCNLLTYSCEYTYGSGNPGGGGGTLCLPSRLCSSLEMESGSCGTCEQGGTGVCDAQGLCRVQ